MYKNSKLQMLRELIIDDSVNEVFETLMNEDLTTEQSRKIIQLRSRYNRNQSMYALGLIIYDVFSLEKNKLVFSILELIDELETGDVILPFHVELKETSLRSKVFTIVHENKEHFLEFKVTPLQEIISLDNEILRSRLNLISYSSAIPFRFCLDNEHFIGMLNVRYNIWLSHIKSIKLIINKNIYYES